MLHIVLFVLIYIVLFVTAFFEASAAFNLYQLVYFFNPAERWWAASLPLVSYSMLAVILMAFCLILKFKETAVSHFEDFPGSRWFVMVLVSYSVATLYAIAPEQHLAATINFLKLFIIMALAFKLISDRHKLYKALYFNILGAAYLSILVYTAGRNSGIRVEGVGTIDAPDSNGFAAAIAPTLIYCLYFIWGSRSWYSKAPIILAAVFIANAIVLINSRGAFLGIVAGSLFFFYNMFLVFGHKQRIKVFVFIVACAGAALYLTDDVFWQRVGTITEQTEINETKESGATRLVFWKTALEISVHYPFGVGVYGFNFLAPDYFSEDLHTGGSRNRSTHSTWAEALMTTGYHGLVFFCLLLFTSYRASRQASAQLKVNGSLDEYLQVIAIQAGLITFIVCMTFIDRMRAEVLYWCLLYCACAHNIYVVRPSKKKQGRP